MKKGSVILTPELVTQAGQLVAKKGHKLLAVFLGSVPDGHDPDPEGRLHDLGYRQMTYFEASAKISTAEGQREWRLVFSCLGAVDAVEAAERFAYKCMRDEFDRQGSEDQAPILDSLFVGTIKVGPIDEDGKPYNGRGPAFFGWTRQEDGISLKDHIQALHDEAQRRAGK